MRIGIFLLTFFIVGCGGNSSSDNPAEEEANLVVSVKDAEGGAVAVDSISYSTTDDPETEHELEPDCDNISCFEWVFPEELTGGITISKSIILENVSDPLCMDYYGAEQYVEVDPNVTQYVDLVLYYEATACQ
ncbi:MAG: hypothetical protein COA99_02360 [Moraxellaceae bacterium]|nr:MAG: hypothetical protein COA99_02360 [Moraxellaceae bacterium]